MNGKSTIYKNSLDTFCVDVIVGDGVDDAVTGSTIRIKQRITRVFLMKDKEKQL